MSGPGTPVRVLHVDDEPDFAEMAAAFIAREADYVEVTPATSATEGLDILRTNGVDCVVSDYDMPGRDGIEFLSEVRAAHPDLPFILFTGKGSEEIASEAISAGVTDYLQKDRGTDQYRLLVNRIENAVGKYRAEQEVDRTHERYQRLIQESSDVIAVVSPNGRFDYLSPSAERVLGYEPAQLLGENGFEYVHHEDRSAAVEEFEAMVLDPDHRPTVEFRFEHGDGSWPWLEARGHNLLDDPVIEGIVIHVRDVTARRQQAARFEALIEHSTDIITVVDEAGVINYESPAVERVLGYRPEELVGKNAFEFIHPDDRDRAVETFSAALEADGTGTERERYRFRHADGRWIWLETVGSSHPTEALDGVVLNTRDITEQKRRHQALERYETMVNQSGDLIYATDADGYLTTVNEAAAEFVGYPEAELVGAHVSKVLSEAALERGRAVIQELLDADDRSGRTYEMTIVTADGEAVPCENHVTLLLDDGEFKGSVGVVRDVSGR